MPETVYTYLKFVRYRELENWSVSHILVMNMGFNEMYPMIPIGNTIVRSANTINIEDDVSYKQVTLKTNGGGAVLRDIKQGKYIGTKKQFVVHSGQFIMSKIDARNGAFGVVNADLDGAVVTADFPVFDVLNEKVTPEYLALISSTTQFVRFAQSCSRGTTNRQRIDVGLFLSQKIPLPTIDEQRTLVSAYNEKIGESKKLEQQAARIEQEIEDYLLTELGIEKQTEAKVGNANKYLQFYRFKDIDKWGYDFIIKRKHIKKNEKYHTKTISQLCQISSGGTPARGRKEYYGGTIPWIKTGELQNEILLDTEEKITKLGLENSSAKLYSEGSLVVAMYGATIGKTAKLGIKATTNQACAVLSNIDNSIVETDYLWVYIQSQTKELKTLAYGGAQPNINAGIIANYKIPIPPLAVQNTIVEHINKQKGQIKKLKQQAEYLRKEALEEFEKEIFE